MKRTKRLRDGNRLNSDLNTVQDIVEETCCSVEDIVKTLNNHDKRIKRLEKFYKVVVLLIIGLIAIIIIWEIIR